jgi:hypothetical protein
VRAQVDRDLTTVDYFDWLLGLIKNLGRHRSASSSGPSGDRVCGWRATPARRRALECRVAKLFRLNVLQLSFSRNFSTEVDQVINRKVVDQTTLYNFYKGHIGFSQPSVHKIFWALVNSNQRHWPSFFTHLHFKTQMSLNMKLVSLDKLHFYIGRIWSV